MRFSKWVRLGIVGTLSLLLVLLSSAAAWAGSVDFNTNNTLISYKGCSIEIQLRDFTNGVQPHPGYADGILLDLTPIKSAKNCSLEVDMRAQYWDPKAKRNMNTIATYDWDTLPNQEFGYGGPYGSAVRLSTSGSVAILCADDFDDCKTFNEYYFE